MTSGLPTTSWNSRSPLLVGKICVYGLIGKMMWRFHPLNIWLDTWWLTWKWSGTFIHFLLKITRECVKFSGCHDKRRKKTKAVAISESYSSKFNEMKSHGISKYRPNDALKTKRVHRLVAQVRTPTPHVGFLIHRYSRSNGRHQSLIEVAARSAQNLKDRE